MSKIWLVTGSARGLGRSIVEAALSAGHSVLATARDVARLADLQEKLQDSSGAAQSYQRALALDAKSTDPETEGLDWFNYGQFLRRRAIPNDLVYACFLQSEKLLTPTAGPNLTTVQTMKRQIETKMTQAEIAKSHKNLADLLTRSTTLTSASF